MTDLMTRERTDVETTDRTLLRGTLHKTSNGLCGIKGYASLLAFPERSDEDSRHWALRILDEVSRLEEIFKSVAALTPEPRTPEAGVDVAPMVRDLANSVFAHCQDVDLVVGEIPAGEVLMPVADLRMVLTEVFNNARECRGNDRRPVTVTVGAEVDADGRVIVTVTDDGPGLPGALAERAAEPFVTTRDGHLGVGLTRVATLMDMYDLEWSLENRASGGVTVRLELAEALDRGRGPSRAAGGRTP